MVDEKEFRKLLEQFASDAGAKVYKTQLIDDFADKMYPKEKDKKEKTGK